MQITADMTIEEVLSSFPQKSQKIAQELTNAGLHCVGCGAATWETLEAGMLGHGFAPEAIEKLLSQLNEIVEAPIDASSIQMTPRAAEKFKAILAHENKEGYGLRFGDKPGGCGGYEYILDFSPKPEDNDTVFDSHGVQIYVKNEMLDRLLGCEIDYQDGLQGAGFKITNPNVKSSCGCGSSQSY